LCLFSSYPDEYAKLSDATRTRIEDRLHALAGSHRGPQSRNEKNPLELPPPVTAPVGMSAAGGVGLDFSAASLTAGVQQMVGGVLQQFFGVGGLAAGGAGAQAAFQAAVAAAAAGAAEEEGDEEEEEGEDEDDEEEELAEADAAMFQLHGEDEGGDDAEGDEEAPHEAE